MNTRNIVLVGFMGTGKSTVGQKLAERLGWSFLDSDAVVEHQQQTTIAELFSNYGEAHFRALESKALEHILTQQGQVLATGGGAVLAESNRVCMLSQGFVVALQAAPSVIIERVRTDESRPLLQGNLDDQVYKLLEQRKHAYDFAHTTIDTTELTVEQIAEEIVSRAGLRGEG
ncbi:shikimate kinase [Paenibacillus sp. SYP-B3998]|uniref:Shikimate kinase n=1 Tax=Paenibacillus sp. SYP-B3998 TaxID=2678564 RepID=A0A6G3ZT65_9BACL|nr:shikimate kinase [Paenibacillus sp. SYP-B3998]